MRDSIESLEEDARRHEARITGTEQKVADVEQQIKDMPAPPQVLTLFTCPCIMQVPLIWSSTQLLPSAHLADGAATPLIRHV